MANETPISIRGNLTSPPELRFTNSGAAVASLTIASTPRTFDKQSSEWKDGTTLFLRCTAWRDLAENIAETFPDKGAAVVATGNLIQRNWDDREGNKRISIELELISIGPDLQRATAVVTKSQRSGGTSPGGRQRSDDSKGQHEQSAGFGGTDYPDEAPF